MIPVIVALWLCAVVISAATGLAFLWLGLTVWTVPLLFIAGLAVWAVALHLILRDTV